MLILAIETSCDETAAAVVEKTNGDIKILSNVVASQIDLHKKFGGVYPEIASRAHVEKVISVVEQASACHDIDVIAVTIGPGLIGSLLVGVNTAKTLAYANNKPIIPINHWLGHIYSCFALPVLSSQLSVSNQLKNSQTDKLTENWKLKTGNLPQFPLLALIVSGGHTGLVLMKSHTDIQTIGQTLDDAAGEAFDKVAKILELGYPGGPSVSKSAQEFSLQQTAYSKQQNTKKPLAVSGEPLANIRFPRSMLDREDFNFSFSGLKTSVLYKVKELTTQYPLSTIRSHVAYEFQQCVIDILIGKTLQAAGKYHPKSILLCGGVSANKELRSQMELAIQQFSNSTISFFVPPMPLTTDNAAMIGIAAAYQINAGVRPVTFVNINANSNLRI